VKSRLNLLFGDIENLDLKINMVELNREFLVKVYGKEKLFNLTEIYLSGYCKDKKDKITKIDSNTFKNLTKLERLWLNDNEIEEIDVRLFESLSNLKRLYLSNNKLKEIDRKCFESLKSIEVILLYENVGLNVLSFIKSPADKYSYDYDKIKKYGSISKWNKFLQQFPELGNSIYLLIVINY
jgi:Leucine-rich repeat (LRR) protein